MKSYDLVSDDYHNMDSFVQQNMPSDNMDIEDQGFTKVRGRKKKSKIKEGRTVTTRSQSKK